MQHAEFSTSTSLSLRERIYSRTKSALEILRSLFEKPESISASRNADVVCLSDGISFQKLNNVYWDKFLDPIRETLASKKHTSLALDPAKNDFTPKHLSFVKIANQLFRAKISSLLKVCQIKRQLSRIKELNDFYNELEQKELAPFFPGIEALAIKIAFIRFEADYFKMLLTNTGARLAIQVSYYNTDGFAFNLACRELQIPCVDIQHGMTGAEHPAYGSWTKVPESGFEILPSFFWSWTEIDVATINDWAKETGGFHRAFLGKQPLNSYFQTSGKDLFRQYSDNLARLADKDHKKNVLISLQPVFISEKILNELLKAIQDSPDNFQWWVRAHPCNTPQEFALAKGFLVKGHNKNVFFDEATDPPLMAVLSNMDLHVTHCSSVVLEALDYDIPSIVIDMFGKELFADLIRNGKVFYCPPDSDWQKVFKEALLPTEATCKKEISYASSGNDTLLKLLGDN